jgi:hypothetical protein
MLALLKYEQEQMLSLRASLTRGRVSLRSDFLTLAPKCSLCAFPSVKTQVLIPISYHTLPSYHCEGNSARLSCPEFSGLAVPILEYALVLSLYAWTNHPPEQYHINRVHDSNSRLT